MAITRKEILTNVIRWNQRALKRAQGEKNTDAVKRYQSNIDACEKELTNVG